jgi:lipopolysaccharide export system protein LptA
MWTPKRIVLLVLGFVVFAAGYWAYAHFLGGIDGLPALPEEYAYHGPSTDPPPVTGPDRSNEVDEKLRQAFGEACPELDYAIKLEVRAKAMVLAAKDYKILEDGRVELTLLSVALFGKNAGDGKFPEINTIRCLTAHLTFDHPIANPADMGRYKVTLAELAGQVEVINNRRTPARDDDLNVFTQGPVYYQEAEHRIWTRPDCPVVLKDLQSKPDPMVITANGLDLALTVEDPAARPAPPGKHPSARKQKSASVTGVDRVVLLQDVEMHLYPDNDSGFLSAKGTDKGKTAPDTKKEQPAAKDKAAPPAKKAHVVIKTQGPFSFDVPRSYARFDISDHPSPYPNRVQATRFQELDKCDELDCEHLELQFQQKDAAKGTAVREDRSLDLEIQTAHATGKYVVLKSDSENMVAEGDDFFYDALTRQSILKRAGPTEVWALQAGNEIHAREIHILEQKGAQQVTAIGPGWIDLLDKKTGNRGQHAEWKDKLMSAKDGAYDLLVLTQDAVFEDKTNKQRLQADVLKVWLEQAPPKEAKVEDKKAPGGGDEQHGRRPHHVEAVGHVVAHSPDLNVHDTEHLLIWFKDAPPPGTEGAPPQAAEASAPAAAGQPTAQATPAAPPATAPAASAPDAGKPAAPATAAAAPATPAPPGKPQEKPARPIDLSARLVEAHVLRSDVKNELDRLWTEGDVQVKQAPANPGDKGVDIRGDTLKLTRQAGGNLLVVTGDLARLLMDKIYIVGPVVNIDQALNKVWVTGIGAMQMDSDSSFEGKKLKEPVPLTVHWSQNMIFWGDWAEFHGGPKGGVQAEQENARLSCQTMHVYLDRPVSLKEGHRDGPPAKVRNLVCDQKVIVEDIEHDPKGVLQKYQRLECPTLAVDNEEGIAHASGPGVMRILQRQAADADPLASPGTAAPKAPAKPGAEEILKLTRVRYAGGMYANNKTHTAIFTEDVHVLHLPSDDILAEPDVDRLPEGGMTEDCDRLQVYTREENGKSMQQMQADGRCGFRTHDSFGQCDRINYDQSKEQVIFTGSPGRPACLYREKVKGRDPEQIKALKIIYLRKTGEFQGENTQGIQSNN